MILTDYNQLANYEGYYASIVYCYFAALGLDVRVEDATNHGRIDMAVKLGVHIYIIEFKVVELLARAALCSRSKIFPIFMQLFFPIL